MTGRELELLIAKTLYACADQFEEHEACEPGDRVEFTFGAFKIRCNKTPEAVRRVADKFSDSPGKRLARGFNHPFRARGAFNELNTVGPYDWQDTKKRK